MPGKSSKLLLAWAWGTSDNQVETTRQMEPGTPAPQDRVILIGDSGLRCCVGDSGQSVVTAPELLLFLGVGEWLGL